MEEEVFEINIENVDEISENLENVNEGVSNQLETSMKNFSQLQNAQLYGDGIGVINDQIRNVSKQFNDLQSLLKKQNQEMYDLEHGMKLLAEEITIPKNFEVIDEGRNSVFDFEKLNKNDGASVNNGELSKAMSDNVEYDINKQNIENINKEFQNTVSEYDSSSIISKENVENINNNQETKEQNLNFEEENIRRKNLYGNNSNPNASIINDNQEEFDVQKVELQDVESKEE